MYRIGIDLGGTFVKAGLVDENGRIVVKSKIPTKIERPYVEVFEDMANQARKLCEDAGITLADVEKVGVGCPGAITSKTANRMAPSHFMPSPAQARNTQPPIEIRMPAAMASTTRRITAVRSSRRR